MLAALSRSKYAITAAPSARTDAIGTSRSRRQASTASSNPAEFDNPNPARPNNSATRSRLASGADFSGGLPVDDSTQRT